ncbi:hypothetical protein RhiXN_03604 [Rhizoctonia solani]|uniref:Uncharacterized protein n=1 Tax=Rhizoctonia solani TaxID=456999 RepID=A0A8H8NN83_9AGAM|nr:uncharacterized protein RhiXN_03604 [Rhizoctonia solani]QRW15603.1 hypothetical protein RhiXN_03604 [Rhizoctonia solani]
MFFYFALIILALPTPGTGHSEQSSHLQFSYTAPDKVLDLLVDLKTKIKDQMELVAEAKSYSQVRAQVEVVVAHLEACSKAIIAAGNQNSINGPISPEIASNAADIISIIVQACLEVSLRLGWFLVFGIFSQIDICLKELINSLGSCGEGLVSSVAMFVASTCTQLLISLNFNQTMTALSINDL